MSSGKEALSVRITLSSEAARDEEATEDVLVLVRENEGALCKSCRRTDPESELEL